LSFKLEFKIKVKMSSVVSIMRS